MAKNTTATGSTIDGVTVVHPDNIGEGLFWDENTKTYYVAIDDKMFERDEIGRLKLRVSALEDNQLKLRDDGLYQGSIVRPDLANLYVANHGNDSNAGTREAPLRTIQAAIDKLEHGTGTYTIYLHENHTFDWVTASRPYASIHFYMYGPLTDSQFPASFAQNAYYRGYVAKNAPRPTIRVTVQDRQGFIMRDWLHCADAHFYGIKIDVYNKFEGYDDGSKSGHFTGFADCRDLVELHGCILTEKTKAVPVGTGAGAYRDDVIVRCPTLVWTDTLSPVLPRLVASNYTTQISVISWTNGNLRGMGVFPDHESQIKTATAFQDMTRGMRQQIYVVVFDDATKSVFGMSLNWDIFANP